MALSPWSQQARQQLQAMVSVGSAVQLRIKSSNMSAAPMLSTATDLALMTSNQLSELICTHLRSSKAERTRSGTVLVMLHLDGEKSRHGYL